MIEPGPILLIGYGNELRRDDGVGPRLVRRIADWRLPGLLCRDVHQLVPELAADIALAREVVFLDATVSPNQAGHLVRILPRDGASLGHLSDPRSLLALAQFLYGRSPPAWLLPLPAVDFDFGEDLSALAASGLDDAEQHLKAWLVKHGSIAPARLPSHVALS